MSQTIKEALDRFAKELPDCYEKCVILTMLGNLHCGVSNKPLADHTNNIAQQMLTEITTP